MQLVEQHIVAKSDPRFEPIDRAAFLSKNLYNAANYAVRQTFVFESGRKLVLLPSIPPKNRT